MAPAAGTKRPQRFPGRSPNLLLARVSFSQTDEFLSWTTELRWTRSSRTRATRKISIGASPVRGIPRGPCGRTLRNSRPNLESIRGRLSETDFWRIKLLIHTHDTFKAEAKAGVAITNPQSHASIARGFLAEYCDEADLLAIVQYHDEPHALWRQSSAKGQFNVARLASLVQTIQDWNLFLAFLIVDGCTAGKSHEPLRWFFQEDPDGKVASSFTADHILPT